MMGKRRRNINTFPTGELGPEIQISVFVVKKEILVQEADLGGFDHFTTVYRLSDTEHDGRPWMQRANRQTKFGHRKSG